MNNLLDNYYDAESSKFVLIFLSEKSNHFSTETSKQLYIYMYIYISHGGLILFGRPKQIEIEGRVRNCVQSNKKMEIEIKGRLKKLVQLNEKKNGDKN